MQVKDISTLQVLEAYDRPKASDYADDRLIAATKAPPKVAQRAMERELAKGLVDYGMWLRGGWLTDKGRQQLETLRRAL